MFLAIDIGNTTISLAILKNGKVIQVWLLDTVHETKALRQRLTAQLNSIQRKFPGLKEAQICSVVPKVLGVIKLILKNKLKMSVSVVGEDILVPMVNRYRNPRQVGQDRLVGAYAARKIYGTPVVVVDLGTAITLDVVSKKGEYLGGAILPGIRLSAESLFAKTALLPKIKIKGPTAIIGRTTQESMLSGIFFGYGALCRGMIEQIAGELKGKPRVVLTGGHAQLMKKYMGPGVRYVDEHLVFKGLELLLVFSK